MKKTSKENVEHDFIARRSQKLLDENHELKQYVANMMERLKENDALFSKLFQLESEVLAATDAEDLCFTLLRSLRSSFELDMVRLWFDRSSFMGQYQLAGLSEQDLVWVEKGEIEKMGLTSQSVWLLRLDHERNFPWLEARDSQLSSMALLILGNLSQPFGVLAIGSLDGGRFSPDQSSDFLQHLAQIIGLTLENAIVRERLARLSVTDSLTGAHNQRFFQPHSHQPLSQWFGREKQVTCIHFDIDDFKLIREHLGSAVADALLVDVTQAVKPCFREQDVLIRMGEHAFVLFLSACSLLKGKEIAKRMLQACVSIDHYDERVTISVGIAFSSAYDDKAVRKLASEANQAMYIAKALGGSRVELADNLETGNHETE
ncbi:MAG: DUF484 family protein [Mariprofundaceae bacterium]|nr:DUF484 family protein [Mariprofundaceae bacterium]